MSKQWRKENGSWFGPEAVKLRDAGLKTASFNPEKVRFSTVFIKFGEKPVVEQSADQFFDTKSS
jgi:hypothetical protein